MGLENIKSPVVLEMISVILPDLNAIKSIGIKRVLVNNNKNSFTFLFRNYGSNKGVTFLFNPDVKKYAVEFYVLDEDHLFVDAKRTYDMLELSDLLPTFQSETGLLI